MAIESEAGNAGTERAPGFAALIVALICGATACGGDEQASLEAVTRQLAEAREDIEQARQTVADKRGVVEAAEAELGAARSDLLEAEQQLASLERRVDRDATDGVLFRAIQKGLLEDESLEDVAIAAQVSEGVVTLTGSVPDPELAERAHEIARAVPGVAKIESRIRVNPPLPAVAAE